MQTGLLSYELTHPSFGYDDSGNLIGIDVIQESLRLDPGVASYSGTFTIDAYDLTGTSVLHVEGKISADRIGMDYSPQSSLPSSTGSGQ